MMATIQEKMMVQHEQINQKIQSLPAPLLRLVELFVDFLMLRYRKPEQMVTELDAEALTLLAAEGGAFEWLNNSAEEDIYSDADGEPV
jgi:hypothetical protein